MLAAWTISPVSPSTWSRPAASLARTRSSALEQHVTFFGKGRIVADGTKEHGGRLIRTVDIQVLDCELT